VTRYRALAKGGRKAMEVLAAASLRIRFYGADDRPAGASSPAIIATLIEAIDQIAELYRDMSPLPDDLSIAGEPVASTGADRIREQKQLMVATISSLKSSSNTALY
jgi:hypothetical protein